MRFCDLSIRLVGDFKKCLVLRNINSSGLLQFGERAYIITGFLEFDSLYEMRSGRIEIGLQLFALFELGFVLFGYSIRLRFIGSRWRPGCAWLRRSTTLHKPLNLLRRKGAAVPRICDKIESWNLAYTNIALVGGLHSRP